jgi:hypothetical protein
MKQLKKAKIIFTMDLILEMRGRSYEDRAVDECPNEKNGI